MSLVPNIDQMYKEMKKIVEVGNKHGKRRRISGFCRSFFFGIKNVRVGGKILGSVGRSETHIIFFWPKCKMQSNLSYVTFQGNSEIWLHRTGGCLIQASLYKMQCEEK